MNILGLHVAGPTVVSTRKRRSALPRIVSMIAVLTAIFMMASFITATGAQASSSNYTDTEIQALNDAQVGVTARGVIIGGNKFVKVCAPKKCVNVPRTKICTVDSGCGKKIYKEYKGYCSSSVGCFAYKGKNYVYTKFKPTAAQISQGRKCAASIGVTWLSAIAGGPLGPTIIGVPVALWGCGG